MEVVELHELRDVDCRQLDIFIRGFDKGATPSLSNPSHHVTFLFLRCQIIYSRILFLTKCIPGALSPPQPSHTNTPSKNWLDRLH